MSEREDLSLRDILRVIRTIINGQPVPEDVVRKQNRARTDVRRKLAHLIFIKAPLLILAVVLMIRYVLPAIKQLAS